MDNNGWPDKPGVPLNPERDRWHWRRSSKVGSKPSATWWCASERVWQDGPMTYVTVNIASQDYYLGPCLTPAEVAARVTQAKRDALEEAARLVKLYAQNALKCVQCGDIRHDYNPGNCSGEKTYRESEEYKKKALFDGEYSAMRYFQKHLCRPEPMDTDEAFKTLATAIRALNGEGNE
jgi:hypothetical protein